MFRNISTQEYKGYKISVSFDNRYGRSAYKASVTKGDNFPYNLIEGTPICPTKKQATDIALAICDKHYDANQTN